MLEGQYSKFPLPLKCSSNIGFRIVHHEHYWDIRWTERGMRMNCYMRGSEARHEDTVSCSPILQYNANKKIKTLEFGFGLASQGIERYCGGHGVG